MKIYPSASAFQWGDMTITSYPSGCLRKILLSAHGLRVDISEESKATGAAWEEEVEQRLLNNQPYAFHREKPFRYDVDGVTVSGRCDFILYTDSGPEVLECKGTNSKYVLKEVIKDGKFKINHLAQLVNYLNYFGSDTGKIMVRYSDSQERTFNVTRAGGQILVDGKSSGFTFADQISHTLAAAECINSTTIWSRPSSLTGDPCKFCEHKALCLDWDQGKIATGEEFIQRGIS